MKTVLLIYDDQVLRSVLSRWLTDEGWRVLEAEDGAVGLNLAQQHQPEVVLCDLLMPLSNGFQVCRTIRAQRAHFPNTKIVVTTGSGYATDRLGALEAGADEYLVKPVKSAELFELLDRITGKVLPNPAAATAPVPVVERPRLKFWGVRGSIPTPGPTTVFYGGNTSCIEVRADGELIILDAGTGIRPLGLQLASEFKDRPLSLTLLISHTHWDHIQGFPFFVPAYNPQTKVRVLGYEGARRGLETTLSSQMESPYFPISLRQMPGNISIEELKDLSFAVGKISLRAGFSNHPGVCAGYRLYTSAGSIAYVPDNEPFQRQRAQPAVAPDKDSKAAMDFARDPDKKMIEFIRGADILIIDAQYDAVEYQSHVGWGHGCVDDVIALAACAEVKRLFLFHHDPGHDDERISRMVANARDLVAQYGVKMTVEAAREGLEVFL